MKLPSEDKLWFVVTTPPRAENLAAEELRKGQFEAYVPMRKKQAFIRRNRLVTNEIVPVIPGYLFLATETWRPIDWGRLHGDSAFRHVGPPLRGSNGPLKISAKIVIDLSVDEIAGKFDETGATKKANHEKLSERFAAGNEFRVMDGPFIGFSAISECVTAKDKIKALVNIFGRHTAIEFDPHQLEEAERRACGVHRLHEVSS